MSDFGAESPGRACSPLLEAMRAALVQGFAAGNAKLPVLPVIAHRVFALANDPNAGLEDLAELIERDQGLAANILRHANSAAYSTNEPLESINEALMRMGMAVVSGIALTTCMDGEGFKTPGYEPERRAMQMHAMLSGGFARELAVRTRRNIEVVFVCGLLHTVGKPVVLRLICDMQRGRKSRLLTSEVLQLVEEFNSQAADSVSEAWNLPKHVRISALFYQRPQEAPEFGDVVQLTALAGYLASWVVDRANTDDESVRQHPYWETFGLGEDDVEELMERCLALRGITASALI